MEREPSRKKKPPERLRPRGAEDTILFRERLDGAPSLAEQIGRFVGEPVIFRSRRLERPCGRTVLRGPQEGGPSSSQPAFPVQTRPRVDRKDADVPGQEFTLAEWVSACRLSSLKIIRRRVNSNFSDEFSIFDGLSVSLSIHCFEAGTITDYNKNGPRLSRQKVPKEWNTESRECVLGAGIRVGRRV